MNPFVLIAGPPGSGKSTLARPLAAELHLPLIAKDAIKEALMDSLGRPASVEESRKLGRAAVVVMFTVAASSPGAILDSTFYPYTLPYLKALPGPLIEIRCACPRDIVEARYRARTGTRHSGHLDSQRPPDELWNEHHLIPLGLGPLIEVDTTTSVDIAALAEQIRSVAASAPTRPTDSVRSRLL
jgi:predicted kinase